ncbi:hypothetical protein IWZ00DRAFT_574234 [Phyllosticta capitalensis]
MPPAVKCISEACEEVFRSRAAMEQHFKAEWELDQSHDYCKQCNYMARTWDELTDHKANSPKFHLCCKFCGEEFKALKTRENHIKKAHPVEQDLRCIGCQEHFVRGYALVGHLEFDMCQRIKAAQFKAAVEHKALINKMLDDPDYVRQNEQDIVSTASATAGSTYADTDFDDSTTVGGVSTTAAESSHILDDDDDWSVADSQEGGVRIQPPLVPAVQSPVQQVQNVQNVQRPVEHFPALPSRGNTPTASTTNSGASTPLRRGEGFSALPGRENINPLPRASKAAVATPLRRVEDFPALPGAKKGPMSPPSRAMSQLSMASSTATVQSPWRSSSDAWETSSQVSEVLFKGNAQTTAQRLFKDAVNTPMNEAWRKALAERDLEYDDRLRCNPFLLRFWDPEHPEYDAERFFNNTIGKYICPLKKCEAHFFEPSKMTEHLQGKHIITQVRCPTCLKLFDSCSSMLAHCENPGSECHVARTREYYKVVDLYSGGFLKAVDARRDDITAEDMMDRRDPDNEKKILPGTGLNDGYIKYIATVPHDWAGAGSDTAKQGITIGQSWGECSNAMRRNHGTMNPSVPISNSRRPARTTASIYPELVYNDEEAPGPLQDGTSGGAGKGKDRNKYKPANHLINQNARRDPTGIYVAPEQITQMTRAEMKYDWEAKDEEKKKKKQGEDKE